MVVTILLLLALWLAIACWLAPRIGRRLSANTRQEMGRPSNPPAPETPLPPRHGVRERDGERPTTLETPIPV